MRVCRPCGSNINLERASYCEGRIDRPTHVHHPRLNGFTYLNLTKLDVLSDLDEIKIGVAYRTADGKDLPTVPCDLEVLEGVEVVYETLPGWKTDISGVRGWQLCVAQMSWSC